MATLQIKVYYFLPTRDKKIPADDEDKIQEKGNTKLMLLNFTAYNEVILLREYTVSFHIIKEANTKAKKYRDARQA